MKKIIALAVLTLALVGCGPSKWEAEAINARNAQNPVKVGTLPDGRALNMIEIAIPDSDRKHYVYFINKADVTTNYSVQAGKTSFNQPVAAF